MRIKFCLHPLEINLVAGSSNNWCKAHDQDFTIGRSPWSPIQLQRAFELVLIHMALITLHLTMKLYLQLFLNLQDCSFLCKNNLIIFILFYFFFGGSGDGLFPSNLSLFDGTLQDSTRQNFICKGSFKIQETLEKLALSIFLQSYCLFVHFFLIQLFKEEFSKFCIIQFFFS